MFVVCLNHYRLLNVGSCLRIGDFTLISLKVRELDPRDMDQFHNFRIWTLLTMTSNLFTFLAFYQILIK